MWKNSKISNPITGKAVFGTVPDIPECNIPPGDIFLLQGEHYGNNRGFGLAHIWAEHGHELIGMGYLHADSVCDYINAIIQPGAQILNEFTPTNKLRITLFKRGRGLVVLENKGDNTRGLNHNRTKTYAKNLDFLG